MSTDQIEWGVATSPLKGNTESGDSYSVHHFSGGVLVAAVDGLGHGAEAAEAARAVVATLEERPTDSVSSLLQQCHARLRGKPRGAVMTLASFDFKQKVLICAGVGNVEGVVLRQDAGKTTLFREAVIPRRGVIGGVLPQLHMSSHPLTAGDTLILVTDGIRFGFDQDLRLSGSPQAVAETILREYSLGTDDALVLVVRYVGSDKG